MRDADVQKGRCNQGYRRYREGYGKPIVLTLDASQVRNPNLLDSLHGVHCPKCGYELPWEPTAADKRHWCRLRRLAIAFLRDTNNDRLGAIECTDAEMQSSFWTRRRIAQEEPG